MQTKNKIIFLVIFITFSMFVLLIANLIYNFRDYGVKNIDAKAQALAKTNRTLFNFSNGNGRN